MTATLIGYARCSTDEQDLTAQRQLLLGLGVASDRIYLDHGFTGTNRNRPGLNQALAAVRSGDTLVVPKLDRLARSVPDARAIGDSLVARDRRGPTTRSEPAADRRYSREWAALRSVAGRQAGAGATGAFQHSVHRGPGDREQLGQLGDRVLPALVELDQVSLLSDA